MTHKRLKQRQFTEVQCREVLELVANCFFGGCLAKAENVICEALRETGERESDAWDTIVRGFHLAKLHNNHLYFYGYDGNKNLFTWPIWNEMHSYMPDTQWFNFDIFQFSAEDGKHHYQLTNN